MLGMDSSEMIGNDYTALCGRDVSTGEVLCTAIINETNVLTLSNFIANLLIKYPNMTFIPEAKSTGVAIIDTVAQIFISKGYNPFTRIFNYIADERDTNKEYAKLWDNISRGFGLSDIYNKYRREFGYRTSGVGKNSRDNLYGTVFNSSIKYTAHLVRDNELITELESLVIKNGRIDHPNGGHDDLCIGFLLPYYLLTQGKNLESYGIDTSKVLSSVKIAISDENGGPVEEYKRIKQQRIKDALEVYLDRMKKCEDPYIKQQLATKAKSLYDTLDEESIVAFNLQDLLSKVTDEARIKRIGNVKKYAF